MLIGQKVMLIGQKVMLIGQKVTNTHVFRVASLADATDIEVIFRCVCYRSRSENVTFSPVLNESTVSYCVSSSHRLEQVRVVS